MLSYLSLSNHPGHLPALCARPRGGAGHLRGQQAQAAAAAQRAADREGPLRGLGRAVKTSPIPPMLGLGERCGLLRLALGRLRVYQSSWDAEARPDEDETSTLPPLPPQAGNIMWARQLLRRIEAPMQRFARNKALMAGKESKRVIRQYNRVAKTLVEFEALWHAAWLKVRTAALPCRTESTGSCLVMRLCVLRVLRASGDGKHGPVSTVCAGD